MRHSTLRVFVGLFMLATLVTAAGEAWARAGSGGSRGSRSYSSPARPSPTSPASPSRAVTSPAPAPRPSPFGGMMGMLGGFALGGLLGGLLFGGLGGGLGSGFGIGMFDILLVGGGLFLLYRFMKSRRQEPAYAGGPAYAGVPGYASGAPRAADAPAGGVTVQEPPAAIDDLERGLGHVRQMDAGFDAAALAADAAEAFRAVQTAVTARDMAPLRARLTPEMFERVQAQCDELRQRGHTNRVERIRIERAEATEAWQERGLDFVTVALAGALIDYTVDATGAVVAGSHTPERFEEYWTFTRPVGPNAWTLTAIQAG